MWNHNLAVGDLNFLRSAVRSAHAATHEIPDVSLDMLRAALYGEMQEREHWLRNDHNALEGDYGDTPWESQWPERVAFVRALLAEIRRRLVRDEIRGPQVDRLTERADERSNDTLGLRKLYREARLGLQFLLNDPETASGDPVAPRLLRDVDDVAEYRAGLVRRLAVGLYTEATGERVGSDPDALSIAQEHAYVGEQGPPAHPATILDVVGASEAAGILEVPVGQIARWRKSGKLPKPYADLAATPVWSRSDIEYVRDYGNPGVWTAPPEPAQLLGMDEVIAELGVSRGQISRWIRTTSSHGQRFPDPVIQLKAGRIWARSDIARFARTRRAPPP